MLERSSGGIVIEPVWDANGTIAGDWDQVVARMVVAGDELDMGMIPTRAWDTEGVQSMRALQTPFLVTSNALAAAVATSDLAPEMLAGLSAAGVTGLALVPEAIRYLFAFGEPPMTIDDYQGMYVRAPTSNATSAMLTALGMIPDDFTDPGRPIEAAIDDGLAVAAETQFGLGNTLDRPSTAIGNLPLFPKVNSLVMNSAAYTSLTDDQRAVLRDAAAAMVTSSIATLSSTAVDAETYCRNGGAIVHMAERDKLELLRAAQPVIADLRQDPSTSSLIDRIEALARGIGAEGTCGRPVRAADVGPARPGFVGIDRRVPRGGLPKDGHGRLPCRTRDRPTNGEQPRRDLDVHVPRWSVPGPGLPGQHLRGG